MRTDASPFITLEETARLCRLSTRGLYNLRARRPDFPSPRPVTGSRGKPAHRLWKREEVIAWIDQQAI